MAVDEMDEKPQQNLVQFKVHDGTRPPVIRKPYNHDGCKHRYAEVDEELWRLFCQDCQEGLDPIKFLLTVVATYEERDYKFKKIEEFEAEQRAKRERERERRARRS
jgi:hypothetical protein